MEHLFRVWEYARKSLAGSKLFLFLDFDGTLSPLVDHPHQAVLPSETREVLEKLRMVNPRRIAIISGRSLRDVKERVAIEGLIYAGNNGFELEGPGIEFDSPVSPELRPLMREISEHLAEGLSGLAGVTCEDKGVSVSVHYRMAREAVMPEFNRVLADALKPYVTKGLVSVSRGKKVFNIEPPGRWNKGQAAIWLVNRHTKVTGEDVLPVCLGDDVGDEHCFKLLKNGCTVVIGKTEGSSARYYLTNPIEVAEFLKRLLSLRV